jgi:hypothetical protein
MMRVYCGRFDPQVGVTLIGYDEPTRSDEDLWAADLTSPTNSVIECLLLEQSPNRLQLAASSRPHLKVSFAPWLLLPSGTWRTLVSRALFGEKRRCIPFRKFHARHASKGFAGCELEVIAERFGV